MADERTVVVAMDGSDYSDYAFDCKYLYSLMTDIAFKRIKIGMLKVSSAGHSPIKTQNT